MTVHAPTSDTVQEPSNTATGALRILETSDLHMQILDYDYFADRADERTGLIRLADKIAHLQGDQHVTTILLDNGDFLQGNPLADYIAAGWEYGHLHPMIAAMNLLGYDALALGNHEFDYGLPFLRDVLAGARCPVVCANAAVAGQPPLAQSFAILPRDILCTDGVTRPIKIGVVGFLPPQTADNVPNDFGEILKTQDILTCAKDVVPQCKAAGADIIVALCHSGIDLGDQGPNGENVALPLAAIDGIDVVLTGHTHEFFPDSRRPATDMIDTGSGKLHGKPAVMPGCHGHRLGRIDVTLHWSDDQWKIGASHSQLECGQQGVIKESVLTRAVRQKVDAAHIATLNHIRQPITTTQVPIHSYFAPMIPDIGQCLLADTQRAYIQHRLKNTVHADLPVLSATTCYMTGGRAGPGHYINIAPGPIALRDAAAIFPFADTLCGIRQTGAQVRDWIERSAAHFIHLNVGADGQTLINPLSPGYLCDTIFGVTYEIDLSQPPRFDVRGGLIDAANHRVRNLRYQGTAVKDSDIFILAVNHYRAKGGGGFVHPKTTPILYSSNQQIHEILATALRSNPIAATDCASPWQFTPLPNTHATFASGASAQQYMPAGVTHIGPAGDGFDLYRLAL